MRETVTHYLSPLILGVLVITGAGVKVSLSIVGKTLEALSNADGAPAVSVITGTSFNKESGLRTERELSVGAG